MTLLDEMQAVQKEIIRKRNWKANRPSRIMTWSLLLKGLFDVLHNMLKAEIDTGVCTIARAERQAPFDEAGDYQEPVFSILIEDAAYVTSRADQGDDDIPAFVDLESWNGRYLIRIQFNPKNTGPDSQWLVSHGSQIADLGNASNTRLNADTFKGALEMLFNRSSRG